MNGKSFIGNIRELMANVVIEHKGDGMNTYSKLDIHMQLSISARAVPN